MTKSRGLLLHPRQFVELYFTGSAVLWAFCARIAGFKFCKRGQQFISANDETLSAAMCVCNPDRSLLRINGSPKTRSFTAAFPRRVFGNADRCVGDQTSDRV